MSCFKIVPSFPTDGGSLATALLLDSHLPIQVEFSNAGRDPVYWVAQYDIYGRAQRQMGRVGTTVRERFSSLAKALCHAEEEFGKLFQKCRLITRSRVPSAAFMGSYEEEVWLHGRLYRDLFRTGQTTIDPRVSDASHERVVEMKLA